MTVAHAHWLLGKLNLIRGGYDTTVGLLTGAMETIGDSNAPIRIGLDAIHAQVMPSARFAAIEGDRGRNKLARKCVSLMKSIAEQKTECAHYLDRITRQPPFEFVPPMSLTEM